MCVEYHQYTVCPDCGEDRLVKILPAEPCTKAHEMGNPWPAGCGEGLRTILQPYDRQPDDVYLCEGCLLVDTTKTSCRPS